MACLKFKVLFYYLCIPLWETGVKLDMYYYQVYHIRRVDSIDSNSEYNEFPHRSHCFLNAHPVSDQTLFTVMVKNIVSHGVLP